MELNSSYTKAMTHHSDCLLQLVHTPKPVRTVSWTGPPWMKRAARVGISSTKIPILVFWYVPFDVRIVFDKPSQPQALDPKPPNYIPTPCTPKP